MKLLFHCYVIKHKSSIHLFGKPAYKWLWPIYTSRYQYYYYYWILFKYINVFSNTTSDQYNHMLINIINVLRVHLHFACSDVVSDFFIYFCGLDWLTEAFLISTFTMYVFDLLQVTDHRPLITSTRPTSIMTPLLCLHRFT